MNKKKLVVGKHLTKPSQPAYYGTAGYRSNTSDLNNVLCRASLIALIRSSTFAGKTIGLMITASHNPPDYNGIKFVDHNGNMLDESWEKSSDEIVNCEDRDLYSIINKIIRKNSNFCDINDAVKAHVVLGRDTRASGEEISRNIRSTLESLNCKVSDYGVVSTPEMHFLVRKSNIENRLVEKEMYVRHMAQAFSKLSNLTQQNCFMNIDTANGVASCKLQEINTLLDSKLRINVLNTKEGILNHECGADYIKTQKCPPKLKSTDNTKETNSPDEGTTAKNDANLQDQDNHANSSTETGSIMGVSLSSNIPTSFNFGGRATTAPNTTTRSHESENNEDIAASDFDLCASFDGDADRLVFYTQKDKFKIFDGDAQAVYLAFYLRQIIQILHRSLSIGVVLSYYSNSAAADLLSQSFKVKYAQTGVKNFVKEALEFDIGIFFEPNGHGSIVFSHRCIDVANSGSSVNHEILKLLMQLFDPCIGDAIANFLVFKATLLSIDELNLYRENFTRLMTVKVRDKNTIKVGGVNVLLPKGMQEKINNLIYEFKGRSFVRPSGTEDLVRVYAECDKERDCDLLCLKVAQVVYDMCDGTGSHPDIDYTK